MFGKINNLNKTEIIEAFSWFGIRMWTICTFYLFFLNKSNLFYILQSIHFKTQTLEKRIAQKVGQGVLEQNTEHFGNLSLHSLLEIWKLASVVSKVDGLSRIVPNLTFWFNDLILERCRSLHENYFDQRNEHSMERGEAPREDKALWRLSPGVQRVETSGGLVEGGNDFFRVCKVQLRTPSIAGPHPAPSLAEHATSSYFLTTNNGIFCDSLIHGICVVS